MIDTVVLEIPIGNPTTQKLISEGTFGDWQPNLRQILNNFPMSTPCERSVLNPPQNKRQKLLVGYQPRLTAQKQMSSKGGFAWTLYIEFSVQKLLFGNNYLEVDDGDFVTVCQKLHTFLDEKGINLSTYQIKMSICKRVDYAKNYLCNHSVHDVILELSKADFGRNFNSKQSTKLEEYWGGGMGLNVYIQQRALAFYDKKAELMRSVKSGDQPTLTEQDLSKISNRILRIEFRLGNKRQICRYLGPRGFTVDSEPKFYQVFGKAQAKSLLLNELSRIEQNWFWDSSVKTVDDLRRFVRNNLAIKDSQKVLAVATASMLANQYGATEARLILGDQWEEARRIVSKFKLPIAKSKYIDEVIKEVNKFDLICTIT